MKRKMFRSVAVTVLILAVMAVTVIFSSAGTDGKWIAAWGTGITETNIFDIMYFGTSNPILKIFKNTQVTLAKDVTFRTVITPSASGSKLRLKLSNIYGTKDMKISRLTIAKSLGGSQIDKNSIKQLLKGTEKLVIPAGKEIYTEEIDMNVNAMEPIAVSMYIKEDNELCNIGMSGGQTYFSLGENSTKNADMITDIEIADIDLALSYGRFSLVPVLSAVDVYNTEEDAYSVVVIGDSTVANDFPYYLAKQINDKGYTNVGVVGKGIMGNCLLTDGEETKMFGNSLINRFDVDALQQAGVKYVICKIGANDIINPMTYENQANGVKQPTYTQLKAGLQEIQTRCEEAGIKLFLVRITPFKGYDRDFTPFGVNSLYTWREEDWALATKVNSFISSTAHSTDVNFNKISADPDDSQILSYDYTEDYFHPNTALQLKWAQKFPISKMGIVQKATKITLSSTASKISVGKTVTVTPTVLPSNAADKTVKWSSSNKSVATVSASGVVKGIAPGKATITCKANGGNASAKFSITVYRKVTGVTLSETAVTIYQTQTKTLKANVVPADAENKSVKWTSSNEGVAKVSSAGKITAVTPGTCTVTVKTSDGLFKASCKVTVKKKIAVTKVSLNVKSKSVKKGNTYQLKGSVYPENATIKTFTWKSSNTKVATVSSTGLVKAISGGSATITCMSKDSGAYKTCKINVISPVTGVSLNKSKITVFTKKTYQLTEKVTPEDATSASVTWMSDNTAVATVNHDGLVTGIKTGKTTVYCITDDGGYIAQCEVTVKKTVRVQDIELNATAKTIYTSNTYTLSPVFFPDNASNKSVKWSSSDKTVAAVSSKGVVTGKKVGTCKITCISVDGSKKAICTIKVKGHPVTGITLNKSSAVIQDGKSTTITATVTPYNAANKSVKWSSSNTAVAKVSSTGKVTALKPGTCTVTCKAVSGKASAKCKITVTKVSAKNLAISKDGKNPIYSGSISVGSSVTLKPVFTPSNTSNKKVAWMSNNPSVVTVSSSGVIKGIKKGVAYISCTSVDGGIVGACQITVKEKVIVKVTSVRLDKTSATLKKGKTIQLNATVLPSNATNKKVTWSSANTTVATVSSSGVVTAKAAGTAIIAVKTADGAFKATCKITVTSTSSPTPTPKPKPTDKVQPVIGVKLDKTALTISKGSVAQLKATVMPADATNKAVTWSTSNPKVAIVGSSGIVCGIAPGTATITVKSVSDSWKATCVVTVK
ncbi:MAG: Ig-like domain-containing protein [Clostridia bacterium]|nr:Ig-like domain-containing protein [Clostridia bacterium]